MRPADLTSCEAEPIRFPGAIQPHGALLVLSEGDELLIEAASENCADFLGIDAAALLGKALSDLVGPATTAKLLHAWRCGTTLSQPGSGPLRLDWTAEKVAPDRWVVDIEPGATEPAASHALLQQVAGQLARIRRLDDLTGSLQAASDLLGGALGIDRVMVYQFDEDWHGKVVAETCADGVESYLGLHFPASDIPRQARELYLSIRVRQIPDVSYQPVALVTKETCGAIDLGMSSLRSVSPLHIEYLQNMGVRATLVGSLIVEGKLWGLVACHHIKSPKWLPRFEREVFGWLCEDLSSQISANLNRRRLDEKKARAGMRQRLLAAMYNAGFPGLLHEPVRSDLLGIAAADGFALVTGKDILFVGATPSAQRVAAILAASQRLAGDPCMFSSHALSADLGLPPDDAIAGVLLHSLRHRPQTSMVWFRVERDCSVNWGGDPQQPHEIDAQMRIAPRRSFAAYRQTIVGQSLPWTQEDIEAALQLGGLIELEAQRRYKRELAHSRSIYRSVIESMAEGVVVHGADGAIIDCNSRASAIFGLYPDPIWDHRALDARWLSMHADGHSLPGAEHPVLFTLRTGQACSGVVIGIDKPDGSFSWISINSAPLYLPGEVGPQGVVATFLDISERKLAEAALQASEARWKYALEGTGDGVWDYDVDTGELLLSKRWHEMLGYSNGEIRAPLSFWENLIHPEDKPRVQASLMAQFDAGNSATYTCEYRIRCKDGGWKWVLGRGKVISRRSDGRPRHLVGTHVDMTERRRMESEHLAARILATQESERARLSHDLHDEIGQSLTALKIALIRARQVGSDALADAKIQPAMTITEQLMSDVRDLAHKLRPSELDELGLVATLRSHLDKVIRPLGMATTLRENIGDARIPVDIELSCFRVTQEALTNCVRHAQASQIEVSLHRNSGRLVLAVRDDGIGFDSEAIFAAAQGDRGPLGLIGMRERVAAAGGQFRVNTKPGAGSEIVASYLIE